VTGYWHPLSAIYLEQPRVLASPAVLRLILAGEGRAVVVYGGDRMWPAVRHGQSLVVSPLGGAPPDDGDVVLAVEGGIPDLLRMAGKAGTLTVVADADPGSAHPLDAGDLLGTIDRTPRHRGLTASMARAWLDCLEAAVADPDAVDDPAQTVLEKYDDQAVHYGRLDTAPIEPALAERVLKRVPRGSRILVAGSGTGREAFALEALGYRVSGVDFSPRMIETAQTEARRRGSPARFTASDLRSHDEADASLDAVLFTYDVYSFVPDPSDREALLRRVRCWLRPGGVVFLSARRARSPWDRAVLSLQWLGRATRRRRGIWGDSHTRWLDGKGRLRRSYVHVFTEARLDRETAAAGLHRISWEGGHGLYVAQGSASPGRRA
jgi:SAM-dependent methyltransferase